jgi:hypothetical protein
LIDPNIKTDATSHAFTLTEMRQQDVVLKLQNPTINIDATSYAFILTKMRQPDNMFP